MQNIKLKTNSKIIKTIINDSKITDSSKQYCLIIIIIIIILVFLMVKSGRNPHDFSFTFHRAKKKKSEKENKNIRKKYVCGNNKKIF